MFKNLQVYKLPKPWNVQSAELAQQLTTKAFRPCGSMEMESRGWIPPAGKGDLVHAVGGHWMIALCIEKKLLPSSVINQVVQERAEEIEEQQGHRPGRKQLRELKELIISELLPRAFSTRSTIRAWVDPKNGWLAMDAAGAAKAETLIETLHRSVDDFPLALLKTALSPAAAMASWLAGNEAPAGFTIDRDCELKANAEEKPSVRYARHPLEGDEIRRHLTAGKVPTRLAMTWNDRLSFVLTDKQEIKRLAFLDVVMESVEEQAETAEDVFDADFTIMAGELTRFLPDLVEALGGELKDQG